MKRAIVLQTEATLSKLNLLKSFSKATIAEANRILQEREGCRQFTDFWDKESRSSKERTGFNSQVVCDLFRAVWKIPKNCSMIKSTTMKFNVPRNCKTFTMSRFFFVELGLYPGKRVAIPMRKNRNWDRLFGMLGNGWTCKTFGLTSSLEIVAYLNREEKKFISKRNVLGIDINAKNFAFTVLTPEGLILKQGYLGQQIWTKRHRFMERRDILQSLRALKKLRKIHHRERNYIKTNIAQMVREIILFAKRYDANIAIEKLSKFTPRGRRFNRKVMTIPFSVFQRILEARCFDNGITLNRVDAYHTSKWCTHCGALGAGHTKGNYALFKCQECGQIVNSDRKASLAVAVKSLLERNANTHSVIQISGRRVPVNVLLMCPDETGNEAVPFTPADGKPIDFGHGQFTP